jgi:hypothetical protein
MAVTKDNVIVISHDPILEPPVCSGPKERSVIHELTLAEVRQWDCGKVQNPRYPTQMAIPGTRMPTLDEVGYRPSFFVACWRGPSARETPRKSTVCGAGNLACGLAFSESSRL